MKCPECNRNFNSTRHGQWTCSARCNRAAGNRELARARVLYRALYWWRLGHGKGAEAMRCFVFIIREIRSWIEEDKKAGRAPPAPHRHDADRGHLRRSR